jgi:hypothetical protein
MGKPVYAAHASHSYADSMLDSEAPLVSQGFRERKSVKIIAVIAVVFGLPWPVK